MPHAQLANRWAAKWAKMVKAVLRNTGGLCLREFYHNLDLDKVRMSFEIYKKHRQF
jgi:hypothetical protein